jgi:carboxypeptidase C (cathepsin A)
LADSNNTRLNPYAWNQHVNMLYIDQPVGTGFSYDTLINSTKDLLSAGLGVTAFTAYGPDNSSIPSENKTFIYGTFSDQELLRSTNNSMNAARLLWRFAQAWFVDFPGYRTQDKRISFWGNSYGGYWVPFSAGYFQEQNVRIQKGEIEGTVLPIDTIGWTNGCTDMLYQAEWYPDMAYNNTYELQVLSEETYRQAKASWTSPGGCKDQILACRELGDAHDPESIGHNSVVNEACVQATLTCAQSMILGPWTASTNRSAFDISHIEPDPEPPSHLIGFFNRQWVQRELGTPVNFTANSDVTSYNFFYGTGDPARASGLKRMEYLLEAGVKVAMVYGDRDYRCPWNGGEKLSLAANWSGTNAFHSAGYEEIRIDDCGGRHGMVRQRGNLSFSRIFQAGHDAAYYQPRTVFEIFTRSMLDLDVATGKHNTLGQHNNYSSRGPRSSWNTKNQLPTSPAVNCNIYNAAASCTANQLRAMENGTAVVEDFTVIEPPA